MRDPDYNQPAGNTFAQTLRSIFSGIGQTARIREADGTGTMSPAEAEHEETESVDVMAAIERRAIEALQENDTLRQNLESKNGMPWGGVQQFLIDHLPEHLEDRGQFAYNLVPKAMNAVFGQQGTAWETFKNPTTHRTWIRVRK
jgi:hypothetical protein